MPDIAIEDLSSLEDKVGGAHPFGPTRHFQSVGIGLYKGAVYHVCLFSRYRSVLVL